ncbi:splicing factor, suppressor of white-apricot homolog [Cylas formicarius]|uniref:splicing factor, suppressor of white-apricot homolog n=1 Tax=Cylas formicarius TaxID=197179 RepID=UPI002958A529|nr:splicing factor, suppressor of white-apricot homolog [Cylas formicarius]XP_060534172.1 splicing factor, suppressor of white-apricot homolog [Cylas formicarius]
MAKWVSSETGILRKNRIEENLDDLLVFGYACKLFRDDEKALYIDQGKHLIPWMGDDALKIDRYDCRGALSALKQYEASREGYDATRWLGLNESERKLEELCDQERYYSLQINEEEEQMYKEEEAKRQMTNAFQYSYEVENKKTEEKGEKDGIPTVPEYNEDEEPYVPLPTLDVPVDIKIPKTIKEYARIEKTALFVCRQGPQMEILIKAKQADNPQFRFLTQNDDLYKFYRHLLAAFKNGRYLAQYETKNDRLKSDVPKEDSEQHYLHPSLLSANAKPDLQSDTASGGTHATSIPTVPYKPSANCTYSQLVSRIQGVGGTGQPEPAPHSNEYNLQLTLEQQQYYQYYYLQQYYEYWRSVTQQGENGGHYAGLPLEFHQLDPNMQNYIHQMAYSQYAHHCRQQLQKASAGSNSYAQIVSNLNKDGLNHFSNSVPHLPADTSSPKPDQRPIEEKVEQVSDGKVDGDNTQVKGEKSLLSLAAAYGSSSESDSEHSGEDETTETEDNSKCYKSPEGDAKIVIDKMADYVSKNGEQFEDIIRAKSDPRFEFLNDAHEYNAYYRAKVRESKGEECRKDGGGKKCAKNKRTIAPVCFSIKKPKDEPPKEIKSALPVEESDDETLENAESLPPATVKSPPKSEPLVPSQPVEDAREIQEMAPPKGSEKEVARLNCLDPDDPILEVINLDSLKDAKRAEDKIKDKLAAAAREKMASVARDKALQLERKRKAAAFLRLKSGEPPSVESVKKESTPIKKKDNSDPSSDDCEIVDVSYPETVRKQRSSSKDRRRERKKDKEKRGSPREDYEKNKKEKKKKTHKRKRSKSRHESRGKKKSKKHHRRRSSSSGSTSDS